MSDEAYDSDGDVIRFLQIVLPPESHLLAEPSDVPVASHVGAPQDAPAAVQMGMALQTPSLNPDPAFGFPAPTTDIENHQALATDVASHVIVAPQDVPAVQMDMALERLPPPPNPDLAFGFPAQTTDDVENNQALVMDEQPPQAYGFPDDPVPSVMASNDPMPSFETLFDDDIVLSNLGAMSLHGDQFMDDDGDEDEFEAFIRSIEDDAGHTNMGSAIAEHTVPRVEDMNFVPFVLGELDCSNCRSVREMLHEGANHKLHFDVHVVELGTFQHAIFDRTYIDANGETILNEKVYFDLRQRTHEWVQNFIDNRVEMLKNDTSGQLKDSCSTFSAAVCTNISMPANNDDAHRELEMDMLRKIFSSPTAPTEAVGPQFAPEGAQPATRAEENINADDILFDAANWPGAGLSPAILESCQIAVQDGVSSASAADYSLLEKERKRNSDVAMEDILKCLHMSKKDAAKKLNISSTSLKRLCRKNNTNRWPGRKIISIDNKIKKLEQAAQRNVGTTGLLTIKEKLDKLRFERAQLYAPIMNGTCTQENKKHNGDAGPSVSK
uniref:RWP-RK domain-containing protein n=1 Tax=Setaria viridis TaxID=4556 RepID=A0A4V6DCR5_SETVI|nr:hypothetical protein SEVIR_1G138400v2 [Setaria viridis]